MSEGRQSDWIFLFAVFFLGWWPAAEGWAVKTCWLTAGLLLAVVPSLPYPSATVGDHGCCMAPGSPPLSGHRQSRRRWACCSVRGGRGSWEL